MADNFDPKTFTGLLEFKSFHITPDKGLGIFTFDNQANMKKHLSDIKNFNKDYEDRFSCKITLDTGIANPDLYYKAWINIKLVKKYLINLNIYLMIFL